MIEIYVVALGFYLTLPLLVISNPQDAVLLKARPWYTDEIRSTRIQFVLSLVMVATIVAAVWLTQGCSAGRVHVTKGDLRMV
jgi:hypothetical protein